MSNFNSFFIIPMSFLAGTFFSPNQMPQPFESIILAYPLTHASLLLRTLASGKEPSMGSILILATYTVMLFYLAVRMVRRAG